MNALEQTATAVTGLLARLIGIPSLSREEGPAVDALAEWMTGHGLQPHHTGNNLWCESAPADGRPTILLNAHIDTVPPAAGYTRPPFEATLEGDCMYGLGSNDDGGSLAALLGAYLLLKDTVQPYRLVFSATAEEEVSGAGGIERILPETGPVDLGIIGEPTGMQMAIAERGLLVLDCVAAGRSGHAAREEGINALYQALPDIEWFRTYRFPKVSEHLGPVKMTVTQIQAGTRHNIVPEQCSFVVDIRPNGLYSNAEVLEAVRSHVRCSVTPRSLRLGSSAIPADHPAVRRGRSLGLAAFGSPTMSNMALCPFPCIKTGPGDSARSHGPDEYIRLSEIREGIRTYVRLLDGLQLGKI